MTVKFGKTNLEIKAEGCIDCGVKWSAGWHEAKRIRISVQDSLSPNAVAKIQVISIYRCVECQRGVGHIEMAGFKLHEAVVRDDDG